MDATLAALTIAGFLLTLGSALDRFATTESKAKLANALLGKASSNKFTAEIANSTNAIKLFLEDVFLRVFGNEFWSLRFFFVTALFSTSFVILNILIVHLLNPDLVSQISDNFHDHPFLLFAVSFLFLSNIFIDAVSIAQTRFFLRLLSANPGFSRFLVIAYSDLVLTLSLFYLSLTVSLSLVYIQY
ncbi:hypothetical protein McPS_00780 [Marichromatium sp. PS1]|uniref:hypothetical protein n=1 Tax=Marichromatium sp. PS1 TaxID=3138932 RepID=UPI0032E7E848